MKLVWVVAAAAVLAGCGGGFRRFPLREPLATDDDSRAFQPPPEAYESPYFGDIIDQAVLRPVARFFAANPAGEAVNVNALDEVPASSWFQDRIGARARTPEEMAAGPCGDAPIAAEGPWQAVHAKPNGKDPGFMIKDGEGRRYLIKLDWVRQPERSTSADVIGSRIYYAAGFNVPCDRVVLFRREILSVAPDASAGKDEHGHDIKLTEKDLDALLAHATCLPDGRCRALASQLLPGKPMGPFKYSGVRGDDPNDVVDHEDRRELRGSYVLAAWLNHFDAREQNTLDMWTEIPSRGGYLRHYIIDWSDCLGFLSLVGDAFSRRIGHSFEVDPGYIFSDWLLLGIPARPWDDLGYGPLGEGWGFFDVARFRADHWRGAYPNPAFGRMSERDAAWMARIVARFTEAGVDAIVGQAYLADPTTRHVLVDVLLGRRLEILRRYLGRLSPLTAPRVAGGELCLEDVAVLSGVAFRGDRRYAARAWLGEGLREAPRPALRLTDGDQVCASLPGQPGASRDRPAYLVVDVYSFAWGSGRQAAARVHLYDLGGGEYRVVGLERPDGDDPPG